MKLDFFKKSKPKAKRRTRANHSHRNAQRAGAQGNYTFVDGLGNEHGRTSIPSYYTNLKEPLTSWEREELLRVGRYFYANDGIVKGAIDDLARYSFPLKCQAITGDAEWNAKAESYFGEWENYADIKGRVHFSDIQRLASISVDRDGDVGVLMVKKPEGGYCVQLIEADRIIEHPKGKGNYVNGVQHDQFGRPKNYLVKENNRHGFRIIPAEMMLLLFDPERADQTRGLSSVAHAVAHIRDKKDILSFEKAGVKNLSSFSAVLQSDYEEADEDAFGLDEETEYDDQGNTTEVTVSQMQSGEIPVLRKGEELQAFSSNRPSTTFQGFLEFLVREFAVGLGLPYEFVWNPQGLTGSSQRFIMGKAQRKFEERQRMFTPFLRRAWLMVISDGIAEGKLTNPPSGWERCGIQTPAKMTIDVGREAKAERDDVKSGLMSLREHYGKRGLDWQGELDQQGNELRYLLEKCKGIAEETGLPMDYILNRMQELGPFTAILNQPAPREEEESK